MTNRQGCAGLRPWRLGWPGPQDSTDELLLMLLLPLLLLVVVVLLLLLSLLLLLLPMLSLRLLLRSLRSSPIWFAVDGIRFFFPRPHVLGYLQMTPGKKRSTP